MPRMLSCSLLSEAIVSSISLIRLLLLPGVGALYVDGFDDTVPCVDFGAEGGALGLGVLSC